MDAMQTPVTHRCPRCAEENASERLIQSGYRCLKCGYELAHIDTAPNGAIRGIFGWLLEVGDLIQDRYRVTKPHLLLVDDRCDLAFAL